MSEAITAFYNEVKFYDYKNPRFSIKTGHFTQLVWKSSRKIGVGIASKGKRTVICINYEPRGNVEGQFPQNVLPPKKLTDFMLDTSNSTDTFFSDEI